MKQNLTPISGFAGFSHLVTGLFQVQNVTRLDHLVFRGNAGLDRTHVFFQRWPRRWQASRQGSIVSKKDCSRSTPYSSASVSTHHAAQHVQLKIDAGIDVYFCDPHSPWQRPSNENTDCCGSTSEGAQTCPVGPDTSSTPSSLPSTPDLARASAGAHPPRSTNNSYPHHQKPVLHGRPEPAQYTSLRLTEHLALEEILPSIGSIGDPTTSLDGVDQRSLQGRVHPHHRLPRRPLQEHRRGRVRHRRLGRLVPTTEGCTRHWGTSHWSSTSKPTTLPSTESRTPYRNGREPWTLQFHSQCLLWMGWMRTSTLPILQPQKAHQHSDSPRPIPPIHGSRLSQTHSRLWIERHLGGLIRRDRDDVGNDAAETPSHQHQEQQGAYDRDDP